MFDYSCNWKNALLLNPTAHDGIGFVTTLGGLGLAQPLATDLQALVPSGITPTYSGIKSSSAKVVGAIDHFSWNGGVGDPITINFYVSQQNANMLKALQQLTLKTLTINPLGWWIVGYDEASKRWYEQAYPMSAATISGQLNASGRNDIRLNVATEGTKVSPTIDVMLYYVHIEIVPAANKSYTLQFATSPTTRIAKTWGVVVGSLAA